MRAWSTILILVATLCVLGLWVALTPIKTTTNQNSYTGKALIGGAFEAIDHNGNPITDEALKGHYSIVYFGFTHCPDICPTGLLKIANALDAMESGSEEVIPYFVSIDPERDTPEVLAQYVGHFHPRLVGITGTPEQIKTVADAYKVYHKKQEVDSALGYLIDHSGFIYLMNPQGEYVSHFSHSASEIEIQNGIQQAIGASS